MTIPKQIIRAPYISGAGEYCWDMVDESLILLEGSLVDFQKGAISTKS